MMKCPICASMCFDDMDTCYGCMYRFDQGLIPSDGLIASGLPGFEVEEPKGEHDGASVAQTPPISLAFPVDAQKYNLVISIEPVEREGSGADKVHHHENEPIHVLHGKAPAQAASSLAAATANELDEALLVEKAMDAMALEAKLLDEQMDLIHA